MNVKNLAFGFIIGLLLGAGLLFFFLHQNPRNQPSFDGFTSATPVALDQQVPADCELLVSGQVFKNWALKASDFEALAKTRLRHIENSPDGKITGAYIYQGIPLLHILEGVAPSNRPEDPFDRPLDMVVTVENEKGENAWFSYGELTMCTDDAPTMLAFDRQEMLPSKDPEKYTRNAWHGPHSGLRLVAARDWDSSRFIDQATQMQLLRPVWPTPEGTPTMKSPGKGSPVPQQIILADGPDIVWQGRPDTLELPAQQLENWRRFGHGRGLKSESPETTAGIPLAALIKTVFPQMTRDDALLFVAIDGYRVLFSGREIFEHPQGQKMLIQENEQEGQGWCLAAAGDQYVDRCTWGISHIVRISGKTLKSLVTVN